MKKLAVLLISLVLVISFVGCTEKKEDNGKIKVVATTTMLADMVRVIGGDHVEVDGLMGPGIDPHLYKASAGDVSAMQDADIVVFNGLHLEGKMGEIFENLEGNDKSVVVITKGIEEKDLITDESSEGHDPHIWFDVLQWKKSSINLYNELIEFAPEYKDDFKKNYDNYMDELDELDSYVKAQVEKVNEDSRILITAHDAFAYFGKAYGFEVRGLQGISTSSEAGTSDVKSLADYIVEHKIKAIFIESSVPAKNIEALKEAVLAQGFNVEIGGELYSDSLGTKGTDAETYLGTVRANIDTIVNALK